MSYLAESLAAVTLPGLQAMYQRGEKIAVLTAYDAQFAALMQRSGVEVLLVGDSLGMVCQGHTTTLPVTVDDIVYHTQAVARSRGRALVAADMPFGSYYSPEVAYQNATRLIQAGAAIVKLEGGAWLAPTVKFLSQRAIPVWAHIGLMPQSVNQMGGYKVQGKSPEAAATLVEEARTLAAAGASLMLLEAIPSTVARQVSEAINIPCIGIGAGPDVAGQVLVMHDLLGVYGGKKARFVRNFLDDDNTTVAMPDTNDKKPRGAIELAFARYVAAVKARTFPAPTEVF